MHKNSYDEGTRRARVALLRELEDFIASSDDVASCYNKADVLSVLYSFIGSRLTPLLNQPHVSLLPKAGKR